MTTILVSPFLKKYCTGQEEFSLDTNTLNSFKNELKNIYPDLYNVIFNNEGQLNGFVNIYLNGSRLNFVDTKDLNPSDTLEIIVSISGG
ncbi:MAG: hypothetical protein K0S08_1690 [Gammaproteobacteria bacterium]|jgi:hypothetical protein|nr:hypothetical protein [Gammaproteobacteria bacterium]